MAGIRTENKIYEVGIYCRLSKDDGTDNESASIATQKSILTDYVKRQGWHLAKTYVDDGYSGTNFQRPSFQNMIKDIENGLINCVITKDLSRLGRNYLDCGLYLEVFFPEHNVRYIAVNDGVDTLNKSAMDITPFRNILNEMYSADVSVKIKSAYRARFQQGKFMGTTAPYGYVKDPADHNHLLIDDKVAHVVREIFDLALAGNGIAKIRKHINKQHILRPAAYAVEQGATGYERYFEDNEENRYIWSENSVRGILRSPIYAGNLAGYKRIAANMKSKKRPSKLPEEWEVIPDTHEGIVTQEEFDTVQQLMTSRRREQNAGGFENIFSGVIKCADCGYAMRAASANRRKRPDIIDCVQYTCNNYGRYGNVMCTAHSIEARDLFNAVLADINRFADMAVNDEKAVRAIERRLTETDQSRAKSLEKEKKKLNKRLAELDRLFSSLYEDKVMERITERNFEMMSGKYQKEQLEIEARLKEVTETLNDSYEKSQGVRDFLSLIRNYQGLKELDATIINALIDKILVSEREKLADGTVRQEIKIYYKFIGFVGELHITPTKRWTALKPKNCTVCGVEYVPSSGISKYCPACAKRIQREKSNESKRRSRERNRRACIELSAKNDRLKEDGRYELISGHRRKKACELAGLETLKCEVKELTRDEAIIVMVESNLQRSVILPSEKAFAYKMRLEAMKRQAGRPVKDNYSPVGNNLEFATSSDELAEKVGESKNQIFRYIRLTELVPEILQMVDDRQIAFRPAVEISYLSEEQQYTLLEAMSYNDATPSLAQAIKMKKFMQDGKLTDEVISSIMEEEKPNQKEKPAFRDERITKLIPKSVPRGQETDFVVKALEFYNRHLQRNKAHER